MTEKEQASFEGWAVVEVFGHQRYAGFVSTQAFGQAVLFRVDVPPLSERERVTKSYEYVKGHSVPPGSTVKESAVQGYTKFFGPGAIYAMTPCTQEAAEKAVASMQPRECSVVKLGEERALSSAYVSDEGDETEDDFDDDRDLDQDELVEESMTADAVDPVAAK